MNITIGNAGKANRYTQSPKRSYFLPCCPRHGFFTLKRFAGCFCVKRALGHPIDPGCGMWFDSTASHRFAADPVGGQTLTHGLTSPTFGLRARGEKGYSFPSSHNLPRMTEAMESAHGFDRLSRRMCVRFTGMETCRLLYDRLSAIWSVARVCRHGWFDSKGGFFTLVAQLAERWSPKP